MMVGAGIRTVGVDAHVLTGKYQGSRTYLLNLLREVGALDARTRYVIYSFDPAVTREQLGFANFEHRRLPMAGPIARLLFYWPYAQVAHGLDYLLTTYISPLVFRRRQLLIVHDVLFESHPELFVPSLRWRNQMLVRHSARRAAAVFTVSEYTREELVRRYRVARDRIYLTYCGPEESDDAAELRPQQGVHGVTGRYFLFVGRLEPRKNVSLLVDAFARLEADDVMLVIVGREEFRYSEIVDAIRGHPRIVHRRNLSPAELAAAYRGAEALVFPSRAEGFGIPVIEALGHGRPVICSSLTALPEAGGAFALYFDPTSADASEQLTRLLCEVLEHPPRSDGAALAAHLARFSWRRSATLFLEAVASRPHA